jgi:hypothetical protein
MWRWIWNVEQADSYYQKSGQVVLQSAERLHAKQWQFATRSQSRLFYSLMACRKYEILFNDMFWTVAHGTNWSGPKNCIVTTVVCM